MNRAIVLLVAMLVTSALAIAPADTASAASSPTIAIGDASIVEGDSGARTLYFAITLSEPGTTNLAVTAAITAGSATAGKPTHPAADFNDKAGAPKVITFKAGASGKTPVVKHFAVAVYADTAIEGDETVQVTLSTPAPGWTIGRSVATGTIVDDDDAAKPEIEISIGDAMVHEGDTTKRAAKLAVTLSVAPPAGEVRVSYVITEGGAACGPMRAGQPLVATDDCFDNAGKTKTLIFKAGQRKKVIAATVFPDTASEGNETFAVTLSNATGGSLRDGTGLVTIADDDAPTMTAPDAPALVSVVPGPGNGALTVFWNAPANDGGAPVTGYELEITRPEGVIVGSYSGNAATVVCGGPGVTCAIRVRAINIIGASEWSVALDGTTWRAPDPVGDLIVSGGNQSVHASWSTPSSPGDFPIIDYRIERSSDGVDFDFVEFTEFRAVTLGCAGERTTCWIRVSARNAAGLGAPIDGSATTWGRPGAPTLDTIRRIGTSVGLGWIAPADDGGTAIFDYTGERTVDGGTTWTPVGSVQFVAPTCPVGVSCGFRIAAVNIVGAGPPSNVLTVGP